MEKKSVLHISEYDQLKAIRRHLISLKASKKFRRPKIQKIQKRHKMGGLCSYYCRDCKVVICTQYSHYPKCYKCGKKTDLLTPFSISID